MHIAFDEIAQAKARRLELMFRLTDAPAVPAVPA